MSPVERARQHAPLTPMSWGRHSVWGSSSPLVQEDWDRAPTPPASPTYSGSHSPMEALPEDSYERLKKADLKPPSGLKKLRFWKKGG